MSVTEKVKEAATDHPLFTFASTALTPLGTVLALGAVTGGAELARRNHKWLLIAAVLAVLLGTVVAYFAAASKHERLFWFGAIAAAFGIGLATWTVLDREIGRPAIDANLSDGAKRLSASVEAGGLASNEEMQIWITAEPVGDTLYRNTFGPNPSGDVNRKVEIPLQAGGSYERILIRAWRTGSDPGECNVVNGASGNTGCAVVLIPTANSRPQLTASKEDSGVTFSARAARVGNGSALGVRVTARSGGKWVRLYGANLTPQAGTIDETIKVAIPDQSKVICAEAMLVPREDVAFATTRKKKAASCPQRSAADLAWVRIGT